jgi:hypothetical protein
MLGISRHHVLEALGKHQWSRYGTTPGVFSVIVGQVIIFFGMNSEQHCYAISLWCLGGVTTNLYVLCLV